LRAIQALEYLGTKEAREVLEGLAQLEGKAREIREARAAVGRIKAQ
jgi:hypothetical protein